MSIVARDVREEQRRAWEAYAERLHGLEGAAYDRAEPEAWEELVAALPDLAEVEAADGDGEPSPPEHRSV